MTVRIVFVCSGNICRSPMAAGFARQEVAERGVDAIVVSCGTLGIVGYPAAELGQIAMDEIGIDISDHYSQGIVPAMLDVSDHVVVMAPRHETFLRERIGDLDTKIVRMWEWADTQLDKIDDPVGQDLAAFRACRDVLKRCVARWLDTILPTV